MTGKGCEQRKIAVAYPRHVCKPEDLLTFVESTEFTEMWDGLGLDCENDATSLELCIMGSPKGYPVIEGTGGLRRHIHSFSEWGIQKPDIAAYYSYFEEYGIVYFVCIDEGAEGLIYSTEQIAGFREVIQKVKDGLDKRSVLR